MKLIPFLYLHKLHGDLIDLSAAVRGFKKHQVQQGYKVTWIVSGEKKKVCIVCKGLH